MKVKSRLAASLLAALLAMGGALALSPPSAAASLTEVTNFGYNPSGLRMYEYVPDNVAPRPALLVAVHWCTGSGPDMYAGTEFASLADRYGFIVVYPSVTRSSKCFDVSSPGALRHDGDSDPAGIVSMVRWEQQNRNVDPSRVYVTGISSGAMMTNVLLGDYPDVFQAGSAVAGVPFGCFATTDGSEWNSACANGTVTKTPQEWGDLVRAAYPGYSGPRPRMQIWHGTDDDVLRYPNFGEQIKQWTDVLGVGRTPSFTDRPQPSWTRTRYGGAGATAPVEAISIQGGGHNIMTGGMAARILEFLGLVGGATPTDPPPAGACRVGVAVNAWNTGLTARITITNTGASALDGWSLAFALPPGQTITSGWNASYSPASGRVTATNAPHNAALAPGASVEIGYQAAHGGDTAAPTSFTLNGAACTVD